MLFTCLFLLFLQSVCSKNLPEVMPRVDKVDSVEQTGPGEEIPLKCQDEEECWLKYRDRVGRSSEAEATKRENGECDDVPENERTICKLFLGIGKRELNLVVPSLEETPARRDGFGTPIQRAQYLDKECKHGTYPFCHFTPGKKKFMVKKAARREEKANAVSSDPNDKRPCSSGDLLCSGNGGIGRKRSIRPKLTKLDQSCGDNENSSEEPCRWFGTGRRKRTFSSLDDSTLQ